LDNFLVYPLDERPLPDLKDELQIVAKFRRALRREDQEVLDDLLHLAVKHMPLQSLADHITPLEFTLLTMLLEQEKEIKRLGIQIAKVAGLPVHPPFL